MLRTHGWDIEVFTAPTLFRTKRRRQPNNLFDMVLPLEVDVGLSSGHVPKLVLGIE